MLTGYLHHRNQYRPRRLHTNALQLFLCDSLGAEPMGIRTNELTGRGQGSLYLHRAPFDGVHFGGFASANANCVRAYGRAQLPGSPCLTRDALAQY